MNNEKLIQEVRREMGLGNHLYTDADVEKIMNETVNGAWCALSIRVRELLRDIRRMIGY